MSNVSNRPNTRSHKSHSLNRLSMPPIRNKKIDKEGQATKTEGLLSKLTRKASKGTEKHEFSEFEIPDSASELNLYKEEADKDTLNNPILEEESLPQTEKIVNLPEVNMEDISANITERGIIMRNKIIEYLISKGCVSSDIAVNRLLIYHQGIIDDPSQDLLVRTDVLDVYSQGWLDCNQQMSSTSVQIVTSRLEPILQQMTSAVLSLKDTEIISLLKEIKEGKMRDKDLDKGKTLSYSQDINTTTVTEYLKQHQIQIENVSIPELNDSDMGKYQDEWANLSYDDKVKLISWVAKNLLQNHDPNLNLDSEALLHYTRKIGGGRMYYLILLQHNKVKLEIIRAAAQMMWANPLNKD